MLQVNTLAEINLLVIIKAIIKVVVVWVAP
jgi:hypothetical protein